jgi:hypothetical protein
MQRRFGVVARGSPSRLCLRRGLAEDAKASSAPSRAVRATDGLTSRDRPAAKTTNLSNVIGFNLCP